MPREPDTNLAFWVALSRVKGLGCVGFKKLAEHFENPIEAFAAPASELRDIEGLDSNVIAELGRVSGLRQIADEIKRVHDAGVTIVPFTDERYPVRLRTITDPPPILYVKGEIRPEDDRAVAVVGSRSASEYGRRVARDLCYGLGSLGFTVVSGMALGIDGMGHEAAIQSGGRTIAVLGSGVDRPYPPEHQELYHRIAESGAVISELPLGSRPMAFNFPARNRIISGLSLGVVVVEATEKSGSLITARLATEQGREVFAVPGAVGSSRSRGAHRLIRQGAKLVEQVQDIIEEIAPQFVHRGHPISQPAVKMLPESVNRDIREVFELLQERSLQIDQLIETTGLASPRVLEILLQLELQGFVKQLPGKRYVAET